MCHVDCNRHICCSWAFRPLPIPLLVADPAFAFISDAATASCVSASTLFLFSVTAVVGVVVAEVLAVEVEVAEGVKA